MKKRDFINTLAATFYAVEKEKLDAGVFDSHSAVTVVNGYRIKVLDRVGTALQTRVFTFVVRDEGGVAEEVLLVDSQFSIESYNAFHESLRAFLATNPTGAESSVVHYINYADKYAVLKASKTDGTTIKEAFFYVKQDAQGKFACIPYTPYSEV